MIISGACSTLPNYPTVLENPNALTISLNGASQGGYDGSAPKSINITPSSIGAAAATHTHNYAGASTPSGAANSASKLATPRKIAGISFDGTADISIPYANLTGKPTIPEGVEVIDSLESTNKTASLSANMGKQLNDTKTGLLNLLDNSDFTNPVNQREATDYVVRGGCIDRWKLWNDNNQQAMSVGASGIFIKGQFYQILLNEVAPVGEIYTFSVKVSGRNVMSITGVQTQQRFDDVLLTLGTDSSGKYTQVTIDTTNNGLVFLWAKLEKGTSFTGYTPKSLSCELTECRRYLKRIKVRARAVPGSSTTICYPCIFDIPMIKKPTVSKVSGPTGISIGGDQIFETGFSFYVNAASSGDGVLDYLISAEL